MYLTETDRDELYNALLGDVSMLDKNDITRTVLENCATLDLRAIEPIIEAIIQREIELRRD